MIEGIIRLVLALFSGTSKSGASVSKTPPERAPVPPPPQPAPRPFLETLIVQDGTPLREGDYINAANRLGCEWQALAAVAEVESGRLGAFGSDGRPIILYERHLFARKTGGIYNLSHPHLSQPRSGGYPTSQSGCWALLTQAYALHPEAALESCSWGRFQVLGENYATMGMGDARAYVATLARSERDQLRAFEAFIAAHERDRGLVTALRLRDWPRFARGYNGSGYAQNRYDQKMAEAYARIKGGARAA